MTYLKYMIFSYSTKLHNLIYKKIEKKNHNKVYYIIVILLENYS